MKKKDEMAKLILKASPEKEYVIDNNPFLIGRKNNAGLIISDFNVSREHVLIEETGGRYMIRDMGSTNGTLLNYKPLGQEPVELREDDVITVNRTHEYIFVMPGKTEAFFDPLFSYGINIDTDNYQIYVDGIPISPDKRGFKLVCLLAEKPGKVFTYKEIAQKLYPDDLDANSQTQRIRAAKNDLSKRLKSQGISRKLIRSKNGVGYQLCDE